MGDVVHDVFVDLHVVGAFDELVELDAELVLARRHLVVMLLHLDAHVGHDGQHLGAQIGGGIDRRHREIAALHRCAMAVIAFFHLLAGEIGAFLGDELVEGTVHLHVVAHVVEDEEFGLGSDKAGVGDAGALEIGFGVLGDRARIAGVGLAGQRLQHVAEDDEGGLCGEGVHARCPAIGQQDHVGLVDRLPAGDGGAVEHHALGQHVLVHGVHVLGDVLPLAARIGEAKIDIFRFMLLDQIEHLFRVGFRVGHCQSFPGLRFESWKSGWTN